LADPLATQTNTALRHSILLSECLYTWEVYRTTADQLLVLLLLLLSVWCVKPHQTLTLLLDLCIHAQGRSLVLDNTLNLKRLRGLRNGQKRIHMHCLLTPHWATVKTGLATSTNAMFSSPALALVLELLLGMQASSVSRHTHLGACARAAHGDQPWPLTSAE